MFCGIQNIPLRGHRDDGALFSEQNQTDNDGNFRALLRFWIDSGDQELSDHIETCSKNSSYISKTIQNDIIQGCGELITQKVVSRIKSAKYFTILWQTTDVSNIEQLSFCIRYFDKESVEIKDFIAFIDVVDVTGANLTSLIIEKLQQLNLDFEDCWGQAFDSF